MRTYSTSPQLYPWSLGLWGPRSSVCIEHSDLAAGALDLGSSVLAQHSTQGSFSGGDCFRSLTHFLCPQHRCHVPWLCLCTSPHHSFLLQVPASSYHPLYVLCAMAAALLALALGYVLFVLPTAPLALASGLPGEYYLAEYPGPVCPAVAVPPARYASVAARQAAY